MEISVTFRRLRGAMQQRSWIGALLVLGAVSAFAADPRPPGRLPVPPKPSDLRAATRMPNVLAPPTAVATRAALPAAPSESTKPTDANNPLVSTVAAKSPIPNGYIRAQASTDWRGQSAAWYRSQAQTIVGKVNSVQPKAQITGVAIVDQDTGDILQLIGMDQLKSASPSDPTVN